MIAKLNEENNHVRCYNLRIHLELEGALEALDTEKPTGWDGVGDTVIAGWNFKDIKARSLIMQSLPDDPIVLVKGEKAATNMHCMGKMKPRN